jgi:protein involved in polysaccharide export with SLBB domain
VKNKFILSIIFILVIKLGFPLFAQEATRKTSVTGLNIEDLGVDASRNAMLARSGSDYRVTPGDIYTLAYMAGNNPVSYIIVVDASYRIRVSNLGIVNGAGKTFMQLKSEVESVVTNNYPLSGVQLVLSQPAFFIVYVNGEVRQAGEFSAWGLSRLSSLAGENLTAYASIRDISIKSLNGQTRVYDLFKARRGELSQDPYLRPGDVITFSRVKRTVTIGGAVERPGTYQLQEGENIKELIELYGSNFTPIADVSKVEMVRFVNSKDVAGDKIFLTANDLANNFVLQDNDEITVPIITALRPVMFVEGAVDNTGQTMPNVTSELVSSNRLIVQFNNGETYASLVRKNIRWFTAVSDTQNAYIIRGGDEHIPLNLNPMLYDASYRGEVLVQENDILIIPFRQYFVTVAGAVVRPGRYPYIPDREWDYYIALAGGFMPGLNAREAVTITDINGKQLKKTDSIGPETVITAITNHSLYYWNQYAPVVLSAFSIILTALSLWATIGR